MFIKDMISMIGTFINQINGSSIFLMQFIDKTFLERPFFTPRDNIWSWNQNKLSTPDICIKYTLHINNESGHTNQNLKFCKLPDVLSASRIINLTISPHSYADVANQGKNP